MNKKRIVIFAVILIALVGSYYYQARGGLVKGAYDARQGELKIIFMDVGQGDAALIRTPLGQDIIIDGGPDNSASKKLGAYLPFGDRTIEYMILTHPHSDHVTGLVAMLKYYEVKKLLMTGVAYTSSEYSEFLRLVQAKNIPVEIIDHVQDINIENNISFHVLFPDKSIDGVSIKNANNSSIVAELFYASTSVMFSGDYENEELLPTQDVKSDVYKVGHHGSNNANSKKFLEAVDPDWAVISVGAENDYGLPSYRAVRDLGQVGAKILRTDRDGDVILVSDGQHFSLAK